MSSSDVDGAGAGGKKTSWPEVVRTVDKKTSWPEVIGLCVEEAKKVIRKDKPDADIVILQFGLPVTQDLRLNRVRIFVDTVDTVTQTPRIG